MGSLEVLTAVAYMFLLCRPDMLEFLKSAGTCWALKAQKEQIPLKTVKVMDLKSGMRIKISGRPDILTIKNVKQTGSFTTLGCLLNDRDYKEIPLLESELDKIAVLPDIQYDMKGDATKLFLGIEKKRFEMASIHEPLISMQNVDPVPHQIEAVYDYIMTYYHIRHMLAHDAGAGKTVMSGLIIKELKARGAISRYCIVVPGKLTDQWRREMKDKFGEKLKPINRASINEEYGGNAWDADDSLITSMDFAKREDNRKWLERSKPFDLIIVDEAHRMSATRQGTRERRTERYELGEALSRHTRHLLFLTATPHKGDPENFQMLMDLLVPGFAGSGIMDNPRDNPVFLRRSKEDMVDMEGQKLFKKRSVETRGIDLVGREREIYDSITEYVQEAYVRAETKRNRTSLTFAMIQLQKRAASSMMAIYKTLGRREKKLGKRLATHDTDEQKYEVDDEYYDDMTDEERAKALEELEGADVSGDDSELAAEIEHLRHLAESVKQFMDQQDEAKLVELKSLLAEIDNDDPDAKLLVFSESKETMEYVTDKVKSWGYSVANIHGGMSLTMRVDKEREFRDSARVMIATEAAGEGINLQFCHYMVNYDIPWNPNVLEQRMGRIHRYGQTYDVNIWNMVAKNTREGQVITRLLEKIKEIKRDMKTDVFDVIGQVISSKTLDMLFREAVAGRATDDFIKLKIEESAKQYIESVQAYKAAGLVPLNVKTVRETVQRAEYMGLGPTHIGKMFGIAMEAAGGKLIERNELFDVHVPRVMAAEGLLSRYKKVTFDKKTAKDDSKVTLMLFGEPLFNRTLEWIESECVGEFKRGAVFESSNMDGYIVFHECAVEDGQWNKIDRRMLAHYVGMDGNVESVPPYVLGNLKPRRAAGVGISPIGQIEDKVLKSMDKYVPKIRRSLERNAKIKKQGLKFLQQDINALDRRQLTEEGKAAENTKRNKKAKIAKLEKFESDIKLELNVRPVMPKMITAVRVVPTAAMNAKEDIRGEIEMAAMRHVMEHEKKEGRVPDDVSGENHGWDIESTDTDGSERLIEVKGLAAMGQVRISWNEWEKAKEYGESYYLYVVPHALSDDRGLLITQDPASKFKPNEEIGFTIPFKTVRDAS